MDYMEEAFAPHLERARAEVLSATWGHLAPKPRRKYRGTVLFVHGEYGDIVPVRVRFAGLDDSPWFFEGLSDFIASRKTKPGRLYLFSGTYMQCKNGTHRFSGKVRVAVAKPRSA